MDTVKETTKLIKKCPQRDVIFHNVKNDIVCDSPQIRLLAPKCSRVGVAALTSISENYMILKERWVLAKQACSQSEICARIGAASRQMESFDVLFGVELGRKVLNITD